MIWAGLAALSYSASREYATWTRAEAPQVARSGALIVLVGFLQGYAVVMGGYGVYGLLAVLALGPILFRSQKAAPEPQC